MLELCKLNSPRITQSGRIMLSVEIQLDNGVKRIYTTLIKRFLSAFIGD